MLCDGCIEQKKLRGCTILNDAFETEHLEKCPCQNCIVKSMCGKPCNEFTKYFNLFHGFIS